MTPNISVDNAPSSDLVYHESAREIVFRESPRKHQSSTLTSYSFDSFSNEEKNETIQPSILQPLTRLQLEPHDCFHELEDVSFCSERELDESERDVLNMLKNQQAVVKSIKNTDWTMFLQRFQRKESNASQRRDSHHNDIPAEEGTRFSFNSFVTSTTMLPCSGRKMRCFGTSNEYKVGVVFGLPQSFQEDETEDEAVRRHHVWSWPAGYSAKTEFNIDDNGRLINGREEAWVPLKTLRQYNNSYLTDKDYEIAGKKIIGGLKTVPYNEVYVRVGGIGRIVAGKDCSTGEERLDEKGMGRSFGRGVGLPVALFVRTTSYLDLVAMIRSRARLASLCGHKHTGGIPLLVITPEDGVRVLTKRLQQLLYKKMANNLNPFQNPCLAHETTVDRSSNESLKQKLEELVDLDSENIRECLSIPECCRFAGGFGATDESVENLFMDAARQDISYFPSSYVPERTQELQNLAIEGLTSAVRAGDYHLSRQFLLVYTRVASRELEQDEVTFELFSPLPPPLYTKRLQLATNSAGILTVLGAAELLSSSGIMLFLERINDAVEAIDEWIQHSEHSVTFRVSSWRDQRASQHDESDLSAFVTSKAILNRRAFVEQLRKLADLLNHNDYSGFLHTLHENVLSKMKHPCMRLEILQYILGLDDRYSVDQLARSVLLAGSILLEAGDDDPAALFRFLKRKSLSKGLSRCNDTSHDSPWSNLLLTIRRVLPRVSPDKREWCFCHFFSWLRQHLSYIPADDKAIVGLPRKLSASLLTALIGDDEPLEMTTVDSKSMNRRNSKLII